MPAILVSGLTKSYGQHTAVEDVSFAVEAGSIVGLVGPNGAGKTTTLKAILGLLRPTRGTVRITPRRPLLASPSQGIGFALVPDGIDPAHRARRHLQIAALTCGVPRRRVDEVLDIYGLRECAGQRARTLSTGQRQRLALATAQLTRPDILVLDEPTTGLDAEAVRWLRGELREHAHRGGAVLVSSHMLFELEQVADHVVVLNRTVRFSGPLAHLTRAGSQSLEDAYLNVVDFTPGVDPPAEVSSKEESHAFPV